MPTFTFRYHLQLFRDYLGTWLFIKTNLNFFQPKMFWLSLTEIGAMVLRIFSKSFQCIFIISQIRKKSSVCGTFHLKNLQFTLPIYPRSVEIGGMVSGWIFCVYFYYFFVTTWLFNWNNLKLIYKNALFPNLVKISPVFLEENIFKRCPRVFFYKSFCYFISCRPFGTNFNRSYSGTSDIKFTFMFPCFERNFTEFLPLFTLGSQCQSW